jgi:hypothetical protein
MVLAGIIMPAPVQAQQRQALERLREAFVAGDANALLREASDRIEIALLGRSKLYSKAQATYVLQDFFRRYPPEAFTLQPNEPEAGNWFTTGRYRYRHAEQPLQVYVRFLQKGTQWELREVRIEERRRE